MKKNSFERFISKYNLNGVAESVIIESKGNSVSTKFITDDKSAAGFITTNQLELPSGEFGVYDTKQLRSLLSVLDEDVKVTLLTRNDGTPIGFEMRSGGTKVQYSLADKKTIPQAPAMKNLPPFEVEIDLDSNFVQTFTKAKSALPEADNFTVLTENNSTTVVVGWSEQNTNRVSIDTTSTVTNDIEPVSFSAQYFKDMLLSNKEMASGKLKVSSKGLAHVTFEIEGFSVDYYLVKIS
jgi:hypothetical protein